MYGPVGAARALAGAAEGGGAAAGVLTAAAPLLRFRFPAGADGSFTLFLAPKGRPRFFFGGDTTGDVEGAAEELVFAELAASLADTGSGSELGGSGSVFTRFAGGGSLGARGPGALEPSGMTATLRRLSLHTLSAAPGGDVTLAGPPAGPTLEGRPHSALSELRRRFIGSSHGGAAACCCPAYGRSKSLLLDGAPSGGGGGAPVPKSPSLTPFTMGGGYTPAGCTGGMPLPVRSFRKPAFSALGGIVR